MFLLQNKMDYSKNLLQIILLTFLLISIHNQSINNCLKHQQHAKMENFYESFLFLLFYCDGPRKFQAYLIKILHLYYLFHYEIHLTTFNII